MSKSRKAIIIIVAIVLIAGIGYGIWWWLSLRGGLSQDDNNTNTGSQQLSQDELVAKVEELQKTNQHEAAKKLIEDNGGLSQNTQATLSYSRNLAADNDVQAATSALEAAAEGSSTDSYLYKAEAARLLGESGDRERAIELYREAIVLAEQAKATVLDGEESTLDISIGDYNWYIDYYSESNDV